MTGSAPLSRLDVTDSLNSILWNEMGFADVQDSADQYSFWPACILFFYVPDLPKKFPEVDGLRRGTARTKKSAQDKAAAAAAASAAWTSSAY